MVTKVISELKSVSRLKILPETGPWSTKEDKGQVALQSVVIAYSVAALWQ